jgi:hypothetical protein
VVGGCTIVPDLFGPVLGWVPGCRTRVLFQMRAACACPGSQHTYLQSAVEAPSRGGGDVVSVLICWP